MIRGISAILSSRRASRACQNIARRYVLSSVSPRPSFNFYARVASREQWRTSSTSVATRPDLAVVEEIEATIKATPEVAIDATKKVKEESADEDNAREIKATIKATLDDDRNRIALTPEWLDTDPQTEELETTCKEYGCWKFDYFASKWYISLNQMTLRTVQEFRSELAKKGFALEPLPFIETDPDARQTAEFITSPSFASAGIVVILEQDKGFYIYCPTDLRKGHKLIREELTGVTDDRFGAKIPRSEDRFDREVYLTYDIWLIAEFLELMQKEQSNIFVYCDLPTKERLDQRHEQKSALRGPIPELAGRTQIKLYPHQLEGIRFLQKAKGRGILSFEMGLGKTLASLGYVVLEQRRALVVCTKHMRDHWEREAMELAPEYFNNKTVILGSDTKPEQTAHLLSDARLVCINYEATAKHADAISKSGLSCLILDESHLVKNPKAKRTEQIMSLKDSFSDRILLSGTPIKNRVPELETQLEIVGHPYEGGLKYEKPGPVWNFLIERGIYLRRGLKTEFPHLQLGKPTIINDMVMDKSLVEEIDKWDKEELKEQFQVKRTQVALVKAPSSFELADSFVQTTQDKIIIFTERKKVVSMILDLFNEKSPQVAMMHTGDLSDHERSETLDQFRDPESPCRVLISTRQSLSVGANLQCANRVIFNDMPYSPEDIRQAAGRVRRLNQKKEVFEYWMQSPTNFDKNLLDILQDKLSLIIQYADGKNISDKELKWMHKGVNVYEISGMPRPKKKS